MLDYQDETSLTTFNREDGYASLWHPSRRLVSRSFSETEEVTVERGKKKKKKIYDHPGSNVCRFFFSRSTHPPLDRRGDRRNKRGYIPRLFHCHIHVIPFFPLPGRGKRNCPEEKEGRIGEARGRFVYLSYKIHSRPHWEHSRAETLVFVKTRNEGGRRTTFPKWADGPPSLSSNRYVPLCSTFIRFRGVYVCTGERWARGKFYGGDKTRVGAN